MLKIINVMLNQISSPVRCDIYDNMKFINIIIDEPHTLY